MRRIYCYIIISLLIFSNLNAKNTLKYSKYHDASYIKSESGKYKKISAALIQVKLESESEGEAAALQTASQNGIKVSDNKIEVVVEGNDTERISDIKSFIKDAGGKILGEYRNFFKVKIGVSDMLKLNSCKGIKIVRKPFIPVEDRIIGEQVGLTGASVVHTKGLTGSRVKVAVIDGGFENLSASIAAGQLPGEFYSYDFTGTGLTTDSKHGTAVAEVIYERAPEAELHLLKIGNSIDLGNAVEYCVSYGINIINHSMGWVNTGFGDGKGIICDIALNAYLNGILWVNSAGNSAKMHYQADFDEIAVTKDHDFDNTGGVDNINSNNAFLSVGDVVQVFLNWDDPYGSLSANDYDLYLVREPAAEIVASSVEDQVNSYPYPTEAITFTVSVAGTYGVIVKKYAGGIEKFQLFSFTHEFEYQSSNSSLLSPADSSKVFTVGAIDYADWSTGPPQDYSSRGPTKDGRIKPDISGVDNNENFTYGRFTGTSSASPCVAGAAALVWHSYAFSATHDKVRDYLISKTIDMGASGKDNSYGYGRFDISSMQNMSDVLIPKDDVGLYNNLVNLSDPFNNVLRFVFIKDGDYTITIYNANGQQVTEWQETYRVYDLYDWPCKVDGNELNASIYFAKIESKDYKRIRKFLVLK